MRGRYKRKDPKERKDETTNSGATGFYPPPGEPTAGSEEPHRPVPGFSVQDVGSRKKGRTNYSSKLPFQFHW